MVVRKKKKYRKYIGTRYARRGYNDRNRGAGNRGGRGLAGGLKKKQKHILIVKEYPELLEDKKGFTSKYHNIDVREINLGDLNNLLDKYLIEGKIKVENNIYVINLAELGYEKLLGRGDIDRKVRIYVKEASESAIEKVKAKGGEVILVR